MSRSHSADDVTKTPTNVVVDAHRQREQLQSHVMDGLKRLELHAHSDDNESSLERNDVHRSSWRCREQIRQRHLPASRCVNNAINCRTVYRTLCLDKTELDKANKDKQHKLFPADFKVSLCCRRCYSIKFSVMVCGGVIGKSNISVVLLDDCVC